MAYGVYMVDKEKIHLLPSLCSESKVNKVGIYNDEILMFSISSSLLYRYSSANSALQTESIYIPEKYEKHYRLIMSKFKNKDIIHEENKNDLSEFLSYIIEI